jgi:hypothetical protein
MTGKGYSHLIFRLNWITSIYLISMPASCALSIVLYADYEYENICTCIIHMYLYVGCIYVHMYILCTYFRLNTSQGKERDSRVDILLQIFCVIFNLAWLNLSNYILNSNLHDFFFAYFPPNATNKVSTVDIIVIPFYLIFTTRARTLMSELRYIDGICQ